LGFEVKSEKANQESRTKTKKFRTFIFSLPTFFQPQTTINNQQTTNIFPVPSTPPRSPKVKKQFLNLEFEIEP